MVGKAICAFAGLAAIVLPQAARALTADDIAHGFSEAVVTYCTPSITRGVQLSDWPEGERAGLRVADEGMRDLVGNAPGPLWDVVSAAGAVVISEPKPGECDVVGYGPPVRASFDATIQNLRAVDAAFQEVVSPASDEQIIRTLEKRVDSGLVRVRLDGSEPGMPNHAFRFSLINASVTRAP